MPFYPIEVKKSERETAGRLYQQDRQAVKDTIAFGRRWVEGSPETELKSHDVPGSGRNFEPSNRNVADNFMR